MTMPRDSRPRMNLPILFTMLQEPRSLGSAAGNGLLPAVRSIISSPSTCGSSLPFCEERSINHHDRSAKMSKNPGNIRNASVK